MGEMDNKQQGKFGECGRVRGRIQWDRGKDGKSQKFRVRMKGGIEEGMERREMKVAERNVGKKMRADGPRGKVGERGTDQWARLLR